MRDWSVNPHVLHDSLPRLLMPSPSLLDPSDTFIHRHLGPSEDDVRAMVEFLGLSSLDELMDQTIPDVIRRREPLALGPARGEHELLEELRGIAGQNRVFRSLIGMGYSDCIVPPVIQRNVLENPGWYTQYTPYQAEIAQGRLEALLNFQTMIADLCGLPLANASMLDEATAAAEAMTMCLRVGRNKKSGFFVAEGCHPQTLAVIQTRAEPLGINVHVGSPDSIDWKGMDLFGILLQYPATDGLIHDHEALAEEAHENGALVVVATDLLALTLLRPPGDWGADIAVGNSQRFGVPLGFGGPHAAFMATGESHVRRMPGRLIGVSRDAQGNDGYRLAVQTREQHIRRDRATSNICTAQVLLAIMASMYAVYHGPAGLKRIGSRVRAYTLTLAEGLRRLGLEVLAGEVFDTIRVRSGSTDLLAAARSLEINLRDCGGGWVGISLDERTTREEIRQLWSLAQQGELPFTVDSLAAEIDDRLTIRPCG